MRSDYSHWESDFIQRKYRDRNRDARFESETYFLSRIARNDSSLLDVGCAEGGLFHALSKRIPNVTYVGVDVSAPLVERARELTPRQEFVTGNILECPTQLSGRTFDITVATGVFQHERGFKNLLDRMVAHTNEGGHILFDVKFFHTHASVCDVDTAYSDHGDHRIIYIVLNFDEFMNHLDGMGTLAPSGEIYGYYAGVNRSVVLPETGEEVLSAHLLLRKDTSSAAPKTLKARLPEEFARHLRPR